MIVGPDGVGKTTLAQQLILARLGLRSEALGMPVVPTSGRVLYLAMDRPKQAARSLRRMVTGDDLEVLQERLIVWEGPPPYDFQKVLTSQLERWIRTLGEDISDLFVDSLKDLFHRLSDDDAGMKANAVRQFLIAEGRQIVELHHPKKEQPGQKPPTTLAGVYGSRWLTAGAGSVALLWGDPGDTEVEFRHLKQPGEPAFPLLVTHDHSCGASTAVRLDTARPPMDEADDVSPWTMARVSEAVAASPEPVNKAWVEKNVKGDSNKLRPAFAALIEGGYLVLVDGPRKGDYYGSAKPYDGEKPAPRSRSAETPLSSASENPADAGRGCPIARRTL